MMQSASYIKRFAACLYELLSLVAIWLLSTAVFNGLVGALDEALARNLLQAWLWCVTGVYFIVCWLRSGQTLAMQAWKIKVVDQNGHLLTFRKAVMRYLLLTISLGVLGLGFIWALFDKEQQFLHDRLLGTRLIDISTH